MYGNTTLAPSIDSVSNGPSGNCDYCLNPNNFYDDVYPQLLEIKNKGVEVLCVAGDIGGKVDEFKHTTAEGIIFLASGIDSGTKHDKALLFKHDIGSRSLTWEYRKISSF